MSEEATQGTEVTENTEAQETPEETGTPDTEGAQSGDAGTEEEAPPAVEIDGRKFRTEKEALSWALENKDKLEREKLIAEAYRTGIQDASMASAGLAPQEKPKAEPDEDEGFEEKFYANPKQALAERDKRIEDRILNRITKTQEQKDYDRKIWDDFCALHPDLADFRTDVDLIASSPQHGPIIAALMRTKGDQAAMDYVAQKTRAKFQAYNEKSKSSTVLPRGSGAGPTPSGSQRSVTQQKKVDKPISMSDQVRQLRSKHR